MQAALDLVGAGPATVAATTRQRAVHAPDRGVPAVVQPVEHPPLRDPVGQPAGGLDRLGDRVQGEHRGGVPVGHDQTFGETEPLAKHKMSHRADAFRKLLAALQE